MAITTNLAEREPMVTITGPEAIELLVQQVPSYPQAGQARALLATTAEIKAIAGRDDRELASVYARDLGAHADASKKWFDPFTSAAHSLHKALTGRRSKVVDALEGERKRLLGLCGDYDAEIERKRREEEERLRRELEAQAKAERERLEAEARAERERLEREAQERAEKLEEEGKATQAAQVLEQAVQRADAITEAANEQALAIEEEVANTTFVAPPAPKIGGESHKTTYVIDEENVDLRALAAAAVANWPAYGQYLAPNLTALRASARAQKTLFAVPGVPVKAEKSIAARRS